MTRLILWVLVAVGALAALKTAVARWHAESTNRRVEIVLDWDEVRALSEQTATPLPQVLRRFASAGAGGVALGEETLGELETAQAIEILEPRPSPGMPAEMSSRLRIPDDALRARVLDVLKRKWRAEPEESGSTLSISASWSELSGLGGGFPQDVTGAVRAAGLQVVPRVSNFPRVDQFSADWATSMMKNAGATLVIFGGDQVLGFPDSVKGTAAALKADGLLFGQVEFGKQKGEDTLGRELEGELVRVHSINPTEMARMSEPDAVDRFLRAAEERNVRALYVRMLPGAPHPLLDANVDYVRQIRDSLVSHGLTIGPPHAFLKYDSRPLERALMGLAIGAATLLAVMYAWPAAGLTLTLVLALALLDIIAPAGASLGRRVVALQGAILFPILAFLVVRSSLEKRQMRTGTEDRPARSLVGLTLRAIVPFLCASAITTLGALFVVGLLSSRLGSVHIVDFWGIKAQQAGAILAVAAIFYLEISSRGGLAVARARVSRRVAEIWSQPLALGSLVIFFVAVAVLALLLARSGNDPGVGVSATELKFRALLDRVMGVRPRTKEFLIGHPAMLLAIALMSVRQVRWGIPLLVVGAIGQVSIVNTFCHLHTPLVVSTFRVFNGLWTGILVALIVAWVVDRFGRRRWAAV